MADEQPGGPSANDNEPVDFMDFAEALVKRQGDFERDMIAKFRGLEAGIAKGLREAVDLLRKEIEAKVLRLPPSGKQPS